MTSGRRRSIRALGGLVVAFALLVAVAYLWLWALPLRAPHPSPRVARGSIAITGARVYVSPDTPALDDATVVVTDGRIVAVGPRLAAPTGATIHPCNGCVVTAGFWNAHVHFTEPRWEDGDVVTSNASLAAMTTNRGFTTVVDTGSDLRTTITLRRRIEAGELEGPRIYTAGGAIYPPRAVPYYLRESMPGILQRFLAAPETATEARQDVDGNIARGADLVKLFTGSYQERDRIVPMPVDIARAAADEGHAHGQLVFAHPSSAEGIRVAIASGVDVLAHAPDETAGVDDALLADAVAHKMAMVPTLKMFATTVTTKPSYIAPIHSVVRRFRALGGEVLFGTDVGYMRDYATEDEYAALVDSGMSALDILRCLTTAPAARFGVARETGTVEVGKVGDLVVLAGDPTSDVAFLARPIATVRGGAVVHRR